MKKLMKNQLSLICLVLCTIVAMASCDPGKWGEDISTPMEFSVANVPSDNMPYILADTITPPANPMAPEDLSAYPTFVGALQMLQVTGIEDLDGKYFCVIELQTPIEIEMSDYQTKFYSTLFLLDRGSEELVRFDHSLLEPCVVGDTIFVTGIPKVISKGMALGLTMYYVQSK